MEKDDEYVNDFDLRIESDPNEKFTFCIDASDPVSINCNAFSSMAYQFIRWLSKTKEMNAHQMRNELTKFADRWA